MFRVAAFLAASLILAASILAAHAVASSFLGAHRIAAPSIASAPTATPQAPSPIPVTPEIATGTPRPKPTIRPTPTIAVPVQIVAPAPAAGANPVAYVAATAPPTVNPSTSSVRLDNYWVGVRQARPGTTVSVAYVIDNRTGITVRLQLGVSIKPAWALDWATQSISDPAHDVTALVPPGTTLHLRYLTIPLRLRPGAYDVAWWLRSLSGNRISLVTAPHVLRIIR